MSRRSTLLIVLLMSACSHLAVGQERRSDVGSELPTVRRFLPNLVAPTAGGTQFWSDTMVFRDWRIQQNAVTGHYRLLDGEDRRQAWGSYASCLVQFEKIKTQRDMPPITGKVVVTLHGLGAWRAMMADAGDYLAKEGNYTVINVSYASTRHSLDDHARSLAGIIGRLDKASEINFVCHSMGNLVVRRYLAMAARDPAGIDPRIKRMVMLGPPNQGASLARHFRQLKLYGVLLGPSAELLAGDAEKIRTLLPTPEFEFAIIAGTGGLNPLIEQDNDLMVTVEETKLPGARDYLEVPLLHASLMNDEHCKACTLRFLQHGFLVSEEKRQPLASEPSEP